MKIEEILSSEDAQKSLTRKNVEEFIDEWLKGNNSLLLKVLLIHHHILTKHQDSNSINLLTYSTSTRNTFLRLRQLSLHRDNSSLRLLNSSASLRIIWMAQATGRIGCRKRWKKRDSPPSKDLRKRFRRDQGKNKRRRRRRMSSNLQATLISLHSKVPSVSSWQLVQREGPSSDKRSSSTWKSSRWCSVMRMVKWGKRDMSISMNSEIISI